MIDNALMDSHSSFISSTLKIQVCKVVKYIGVLVHLKGESNCAKALSSHTLLDKVWLGFPKDVHFLVQV